ncbi:hypothetical protein B566_EDAN003499 [Ephemera danica]|nr:hypothetical protein B566_EDAN003499 [Ephemera danica]
MALLAQGKFLKSISRSVPSSLVRSVSAHHPSNDVQRSVFISQSNDIFANLALEDWLYRHSDFSKHRVLLLWRNTPCVVIGRHQNPWREAQVGALAENKVALARRNSGGGTVYHDEGNLNLSFFTPREAYNRKTNLRIISNALRREWGIESLISPRDDLILEGNFKVSFSSTHNQETIFVKTSQHSTLRFHVTVSLSLSATLHVILTSMATWKIHKLVISQFCIFLLGMYRIIENQIGCMLKLRKWQKRQ